MRRATLVFFVALLASACAPSTDATPPTPAPTPSYRQSVLADHPVGFWPMDETSGSVMADASGNHNDGAYVGSVGLAQPGPFKAAANHALALDGATAWAAVPNSTSLQVNTVTIELWIDKRAEVQFGTYVSKNLAVGGLFGTSWFQLMNNGHDGHLQFRVTADYPTVVSSAALALNTWYYVVATYDGTTARLYVNGKLDSSAPVNANPKQTADPLYIGRRPDGFLNNALFSAVAIYPSALSADRIAEHWQAANAGG